MNGNIGYAVILPFQDFHFIYSTYASLNTGGDQTHKADYCLKHFKHFKLYLRSSTLLGLSDSCLSNELYKIVSKNFGNENSFEIMYYTQTPVESMDPDLIFLV